MTPILLPAPVKSNPRRSLPIILPSAAPICLPAPAAPLLIPAWTGIRPFEYSNDRLAKVGPHQREQLMLQAERLLDHALLYLLGDENEHQWYESSQAFYKSLREGKSGKAPAPRASKYTLPPSADQERQTARNADEGRRLAFLLKAWLDIDARPAGGLYETDGTRYRLKAWYGADGMLVEKRAARGWRSSRIAFSKAEFIQAVTDLDNEISRHDRRQPHSTALAVIDDAPPVDAPRARLRPEDHEAFMRGFNRGR